MARETQVRAMSLPPFPVHAELISVAADPLRLAILVPTVSSWPDGRASVGAISLAVRMQIGAPICSAADGSFTSGAKSNAMHRTLRRPLA